jgi:acetyltransferase-like isoleucine patch superfamily enzyme
MLIQKPRLPVKQIVLTGILPGFLKKAVYRLKGYRIGHGVSIGFGSVVCAPVVAIGDYTSIGPLTIIRGNKITIGSHVKIGSLTFIDTPYIDIGDESKINEQVYIGGLQSYDSTFTLGKNCQVMQMSFINPAKSITIGDDSVVGGHGLLFGHNSWQNRFDGYGVDFEPIEIGNRVALSWRVFVLPGIKIGDGSVIAPDSLVTKSIPPLSLAAGYPARVISKAPDFPEKLSDAQKVQIFDKIVNEMAAYFDGSGFPVVRKPDLLTVTRVKKHLGFSRRRTWLCGLTTEDLGKLSSDIGNSPLEVFVSLKAIPAEVRRAFNDKHIMWLDIEKKERPLFWNDLGEEVALFFRRYGVRFNRVRE